MEIERSLGIPRSGPTGPSPLPSATTFRILLAEDNSVNQRLVAEFLQKWGHKVTLASNGLEAVEAFRAQPASEPFDLVLMDIGMPEIDGLEATRRIRSLGPDGAQVRIVALTAHAIRGDRERCLAAGMDGYLSKPVRPETLRDAIERYAPSSGEQVSTVHQEQTPISPGEESPVSHQGNVPSSPTPIDWTEALDYVDQQQELLDELAATFIEGCPEWLKAVEEGISRQSADDVSKAAHSLKGAALALAAHPLAEISLRLERAGREGRMEEIRAVWPDLHGRTAELLVALRDRLRARRGGVQPPSTATDST